jgi:uncharacterized tellurite resistance protein B-like protein
MGIFDALGKSLGDALGVDEQQVSDFMDTVKKATAPQPVQMEPTTSLTVAMLSMLYADGVVDTNEVAAIMAVGCIEQADFDMALQLYTTKLFTPSNCVQSVALGLPRPEQRKACLILMLDLAMADGNLAGAERTLFEEYVATFDVPTADIEKAMRVLGRKNNPTVFEGTSDSGTLNLGKS